MTVAELTLDRLIAEIRDAVRLARTDKEAAKQVANAVRRRLPGPGILRPEQRAGSPDGYAVHTLYASPEFSVVAAVFRPGQETPIHDHVTWCVVGVVQGVEHETIYALRDGEPVPVQVNDNEPGTIAGFAPPGDIHRVVNVNDDVAISMHVYGVDIDEAGSSVRRTYR